MPVTVAQPKTAHPNFWVVCCEETEATQQISKAISDWQLPEVRSLISEQLPPAVADAVAPADYAIFITSCPHPTPQIKVNPISSLSASTYAGDVIDLETEPLSIQHKHPAKVLSDAQVRHGRAPQSWLFQLPTTERSANREQPVDTEKSVAEALNQIEVFIRNYIPARTRVSTEAREQSAQTSSSEKQQDNRQTVRSSATEATSQQENVASDTSSAQRKPASPQPEKKKVVLSHYRRI